MERKALHTEQIRLGNRKFLFNIKQTEKGSSYLSITLTKKTDEENYERSNIVIFESEMEKFGEAFMRSLINFRMTGREARVSEAKKKYPKAFDPWTKEDEQQLEVMFGEGQAVNEIAKKLQRNENAINARIAKLELADKYILPATA